ncbi:MAG: UPF0158 family protein [Bryobacteraceae bacterium]|jgi:hypothetical protein
MKVSLKRLADELESLSDEHRGFLDRQTGEVEWVSLEVLGLVEEGGTAGELLQWQRCEFEVAKSVIENRDRFAKLPTKFDVHEWEIMREFAESVEPEQFSDHLQRAIHASGAFRYFKDTLRRYRREQDWFDFKAEALREIAIDWCEQNGIEYLDD